MRPLISLLNFWPDKYLSRRYCAWQAFSGRSLRARPHGPSPGTARRLIANSDGPVSDAIPENGACRSMVFACSWLSEVTRYTWRTCQMEIDRPARPKSEIPDPYPSPIVFVLMTGKLPVKLQCRYMICEAVSERPRSASSTRRKVTPVHESSHAV